MGYDATNYLPTEARLREVEEFLCLLGFTRQGPRTFLYFDDQDYQHESGVLATTQSEEGGVQVWTHTWGLRSKADADAQNHTIRQLKKRFGGHFVSDKGKGRYLPFEGQPLRPAEAGCGQAYSRFGHNIIRARIYLDSRTFQGPQWQKTGAFAFLDWVSPVILSNHLLATYLTASWKDFLRSIFVVLLQYSEQKSKVLRNARFHPSDLVEVSDRQISLEQAVANSMTFMDLTRACESFKNLDQRLDFAAELRRPHRRRKSSLFQSLLNLVARRNAFVHRNTVDSNYESPSVLRDVEDVKAAAYRVYKLLTHQYGWELVETWSA